MSHGNNRNNRNAPHGAKQKFPLFLLFPWDKKISIRMSKQGPTEITEITERLRIIGAKISVISVISVGLKTLYQHE